MECIVIRQADRDDLRGLLDLYRHLHPDNPDVDADATNAAWSMLLSSGATRVVVADASGILASSCTLTIIPNLTRGCRSYGLIENVVTDSAYRKRGLGRRVLTEALNFAQDAGCYKVSLATGSKQEATLRFYEAAGFTQGTKAFFEIRWP